MKYPRHVKKLIVINVMAMALVACGEPESEVTSAAPHKAPSIDVSAVLSETINDWDTHSGRLQAPETVVLIPRVSGYIEKVNFAEGALVTAGEVLIEIDPRPFKAEVARLKAELRSAQAGLSLATKDYDRAQRLRKQGAISEEVIDSRYSAKQQATANVMGVQATLERAELDLSFTKVLAPISGRLSYAQVTAGNYVTAGQTQLTRLVSTSRMYAYFDVDEATYLNYSRNIMSPGKQGGRDSNPVYMGLANESLYPYQGYVDFVDNAVNQQTGTIRIRAVFNNESGELLPGLYTRLKMPSSSAYEAVLINEKAVGTDLNNKYVLVVNGENKVEYRPVQLGEKINGMQVVESGLQAGEKIVVNGLQRLYPGTQIDPKVIPMTDAQALADLRTEQIKLAKYRTSLADLVATND